MTTQQDEPPPYVRKATDETSVRVPIAVAGSIPPELEINVDSSRACRFCLDQPVCRVSPPGFCRAGFGAVWMEHETYLKARLLGYVE